MSEELTKEFKERATADELRTAIARLEGQLAKAKDRSQQMREAVRIGAREAIEHLGPLPPVTPPKPRRGAGKPEVALWHLTDWQGSKVTQSYDTEVMHERVRRYVEKARWLTEIQRAHHPVETCVILFGGDMVEGLFNYPAQLWQIDSSLFTQWATVSRLMAEVVRGALSIYQHVKVVGEWGNHGRIGSKRAEVPKEDNIDRMCYEHARALLSAEDRLEWDDSAEDIQYVQIGNYRALLLHGDECGRFGTVSVKTFTDYCNRLKAGAYPLPFQDVYVGHYHRHAEEPMAEGSSIFWTGSTESDNRYASVGLGASASPSQRLHFVEPTKGHISAQYRVWL